MSKDGKRIADVKAKDEFDSIIKSPNLTVVHFWASWAAQCEPMDEAMKILAEEEPSLKDVNFVRVEAEEAADLSLEFEVAAVPTFVFFRSSNVIQRIEGAKAADLTKTVTALAAKKGQDLPKPPPEKPSESIEERLKKLINESPVMLFMKGNPSEPKCGFSRQTVELLNSLDATYGTFDILSDNDVRQGLKTFSNWPTYPQLYVKGELIGGLDILKEMHESGDLEETLKG